MDRLADDVLLERAAWDGRARLHISRAGYTHEVRLAWVTKPTPPGRVQGWGGAFRAEPLVVPATGRAIVTFPSGEEAEVMVESFDALTGEGTFFGLGSPPRGPE